MNLTSTKLKGRIVFIVVELGEQKSGRDEKLCEVHNNAEVLIVGQLTGVYDPATADWYREFARELRGLQDTTRAVEHPSTLFHFTFKV